jgi:hypothetical protein
LATAITQQVGDARLPARREGAGGKIAAIVALELPPQMRIPTGRCYACAVAARRRESAVRPRYPCGRHLDLGQAFEERAIFAGADLAAQGRHVPRAADYGEASLALFERGCNGEAHVRLALLLDKLFGWSGRRISIDMRAQFCHRGLDGGEDRRRIGALLDQRVPPRLAVVVAGDGCKIGERIACDGVGTGLVLRLGACAFVAPSRPGSASGEPNPRR